MHEYRLILLYLIVIGLLLTVGCAKNSGSEKAESITSTVTAPVIPKHETASDKHSLSETDRKRIFKAITDAELRATDEAVDGTATDIDALKKQAARSKELREVYLDQVAKKYGVTRDTLKQISLEGVLSDWPM